MEENEGAHDSCTNTASMATTGQLSGLFMMRNEIEIGRLSAGVKVYSQKASCRCILKFLVQQYWSLLNCTSRKCGTNVETPPLSVSRFDNCCVSFGAARFCTNNLRHYSIERQCWKRWFGRSDFWKGIQFRISRATESVQRIADSPDLLRKH
jgi:hypothetical protein